MKMVLAMVCSATAFPAMLGERLRPIVPSDDELIPTQPGGWYHKMKNLTTEYIDADPQWWGKFYNFAIFVAFLLGLIIGVFHD